MTTYEDSTGKKICLGDKIRSLSRNNVISGSGGYEWELVFHEGIYWSKDRFGGLNALAFDQPFWMNHLIIEKTHS